MKQTKILVVAAHPDDEVLGCGGTVARLVSEGAGAHTLILGEGVTSRDTQRDRSACEKEISELREQIRKANAILGVSSTHIEDFPDNRFDNVNLLDIVKVVESVVNEISPEIIFTHYGNDLNIDHKIVFDAVLTATRPMQGEVVKEIYSFEVLSSTEWNFPLSFSPDTFYDVTDSLIIKQTAMEAYVSELREFPHPRSIEGIRLNAAQWGMKVGVTSAEAFKSIRVIK